MLIYNTTGVDAFFLNSTCSKVLARFVCQVVITQVVGLMVGGVVLNFWDEQCSLKISIAQVRAVLIWPSHTAEHCSCLVFL